MVRLQLQHIRTKPGIYKIEYFWHNRNLCLKVDPIVKDLALYFLSKVAFFL